MTNCVTHATTTKSDVQWAEMTYNHTFKMLGKSRNQYITDITNAIYSKLDSPSRNRAIKELNPIFAVIAAPRQGKSLFLDMLCEQLRSKGRVLSLSVSYNSDTPHIPFLEDSNISVYFYGRVIYAISKALDVRLSLTDLQSKPFFNTLTARSIHELCQKLWPDLTLCIAADEFSRCLLGDEDKWKIQISAISSSLYSIGYCWQTPVQWSSV